MNRISTIIQQKKLQLVFILIILFGAMIRFYALGLIPSGLSSDEAAIGFNANSILQTGRDEFGKHYPIYFKSFNDYKSPLYIYFTVPIIAMLGMHNWSVRLLSSVFGLFSILGIFFLTRELCRHDSNQTAELNHFKRKNINKSFDTPKLHYRNYIPYLAATFLTISPWHIYFSRLSEPIILALTCNIWGTLFFLKINESKFFVFISAVFLSLGIYSYQSEIFFVPLLILLLSIIYNPRKKVIQFLIIFFSLMIIFCSPLILDNLKNNGQRQSENNITN